MVSWTRLLAGDLRDPMVARDVLIGTSVIFSLLTASILLLMLLPPGPLVVVKRSLVPLMGTSGCMTSTAEAVYTGVRFGLLCMLLLLLLRFVTRFRRLAPFALGVVLSAATYAALWGGGTASLTAIVLSVLFAGTTVLLLARFGFLAAVIALFLQLLSLGFPGTTRLTGWYAFCTWWAIGVTVLLTAYGLYFATGGRPFGENSFLEKSA